MLHDHTPRRRDPLHRRTHQSFVLYTAPVVRETRHERTQLLYINEFTLALLAEGDTCVRMDANTAVARNDRLLNTQVIQAVGYRAHVRHRKHIAVSRTHRCRAARKDRLFIRETGWLK